MWYSIPFIIIFNARPLGLKFPRSLMFPKKGLVFDSVYVIDAYAAYVPWKNMIPTVEFTEKTKVTNVLPVWPVFHRFTRVFVLSLVAVRSHSVFLILTPCLHPRFSFQFSVGFPAYLHVMYFTLCVPVHLNLYRYNTSFCVPLNSPDFVSFVSFSPQTERTKNQPLPVVSQEEHRVWPPVHEASLHGVGGLVCLH